MGVVVRALGPAPDGGVPGGCWGRRASSAGTEWDLEEAVLAAAVAAGAAPVDSVGKLCVRYWLLVYTDEGM